MRPHERLPQRAARAAALAAVYERASSKTVPCSPDNRFEAEQQTAFLSAKWQEVEDAPEVEFRARMHVELLADDAARAEQFDTARRATRLDQELIKDQMEFLREEVLKDDKTAALWWLQRNLAGPVPATSWADFDKIVVPLLSRQQQASDPVDRFAETMLDLVKRIHDRPELLDTLAAAGTLALNFVDEANLANRIAPRTSSPMRQGDNGIPRTSGDEPG